MHSYFICPRCGKKSFQAIPPPKSGVDVLSCNCKRCGTRGIQWVANENDAKQVRGLVAIGGGIATIADKEPGVAIGGNQDVGELITGRTPAILADAYSQKQRHKDYTPNWTDVKEGVCEGQCLHWLRRVLTGGRLIYGKPQSGAASGGPAKSPEQRAREQHKAGAIVHRALQQDVVQIRTNNWNNIFAQLQQKGATQAQVDSAQARFEQATRYRYDWSQIAEHLDAKLTDPDVARKHGFSGIVCTKSDGQKDFKEGPGAFALALTKDEDFKVGTGVLISSSLAGIGESGGSIEGHSIAAYFARNDVLLLFDPNVGIFLCKKKDDFKAALSVLMGAWVAILGWKLNNKFGYSVFTNRDTPGEVRPREKHVAMTASPQGTYYANKTIIPGK